MKRWKWFGLAAALLALPLIVLAAGPPGGQPRGQRGDERGAGLINRFDANGDGQISEGEWTDAFRKLDADNDGIVTREELQEAAKQAREAAWDKLDANGDGALSVDEFPGRAEAFKRIDADGDGLVTKQELAAGRERLRRWRQNRTRQGPRGPREAGADE